MRYLVVATLLLLTACATTSMPVVGKAPGKFGTARTIRSMDVLTVYTKETPRKETTLQTTDITGTHLVGYDCYHADKVVSVPLDTISHVKRHKGPKRIGQCSVTKSKKEVPSALKTAGKVAGGVVLAVVVIYGVLIGSILFAFASL